MPIYSFQRELETFAAAASLAAALVLFLTLPLSARGAVVTAATVAGLAFTVTQWRSHEPHTPSAKIVHTVVYGLIAGAACGGLIAATPWLL